MAQTTLALTVESTPLLAALERASALAEASPEFRDDLVRLLEFGDGIGCIHSDGATAAGTREVIFRLEPSDGLRGLLATMGAGDV